VVEQLDNTSERVDLEVGTARIRLTNLGREYWPGQSRPRRAAITKRDLLRYLARVSPYLLPHLVDRPLTMIRMPEGIDGERFFQKHWTQERPAFVETINVWSGSKSERQEYLLANNLPTLLWLGQVGTLEFHVWHSRAAPAADAATDATDYSSSEQSLEESILNYPDYLVFDIDPYIYSARSPRAPSRSSTSADSPAAAALRSGYGSCLPRCRSRPWSRPRARRGCTCSCRSIAP
jgi:bifunctional non-homologous end joining protein LigD